METQRAVIRLFPYLAACDGVNIHMICQDAPCSRASPVVGKWYDSVVVQACRNEAAALNGPGRVPVP